MTGWLAFIEQRWGNVARTGFDRLRAGLWRFRGARLGAKCRVGPDCQVERPWGLSAGQRVQIERGVHIKLTHDCARLSLGAHTFIGYGTTLDVSAEVVIGDHVLIAPGCFITDHEHNHAAGQRIGQQGTHSARVHVGDDAWIGANAVVLLGVTIGAGAIVGAGAVVTRDVSPGTIVAGVPARPIGQRRPP